MKECYEIEQGRVETMFHLMDNREWDLFWTVLTSPDRVQHHFWKFMDTKHPQFKPERSAKYGKEILKIYQYMDEVLGKLMKKLPHDAVLILLSDHGFGPVYKSINVADFLFGDDKLTSLAARLLKVNYNSFFSGAFYVNQKIRESHGSVESSDYEDIRNYLVTKLENLKDPETGAKVIEKIYRREELFSGAYSFLGPDIFCLEKPTYLFSGIKVKPDGKMIEPFPSFAISGSHRPEGIFAIGGKPVRENLKLNGAQIADITPTVMYLMGLNIPDYMEGRVLHQTIEPEYFKNHPPKISKMPSDTDKKMLDQLKKLGYIK